MFLLDWNLARAFCATADTGSLSSAARRIGLTQPTLSRQVAALEADLGVALFERIGKRLVLTEAGAGLLPHARAMSAAAQAMELAAAGKDQEIAGRVTISATDVMAAYILPGIVAEIRAAAPQITIVIQSSNAISDLRRREADIAIRHVRPTEDDLICRHVRTYSAHFYAAESWIARRGAPVSVTGLAASDLLGFDPVERFAAHLNSAGVPVSADEIRIVSENAVVVWEMVLQGLGVGVMLREIAERTPGAVQVLADLPPTPVPVWLVSHRELTTSRRVRHVFEALAEGLRRAHRGEGA